MRAPIPLLGALALAGCTLIPDYPTPAPPVPDAFPAEGQESASADAPAAATLDWRDFLLDERLRAVVESALAGNRDLRVAALQVEQAAALLRIQRSGLTPSVGIQGAGQRARLPEKMTESGEAETRAQYSVEIGFLSWEIDLFGRLRSLSAAALERYLATEEGERAVRSTLVAAAASSWLRLAADAESLRLAEATMAAQRAALDLVRASRDAGVASDLELRQAESQVEAARLARAEFAGALAVDRHALELLLGGPLAPELEPAGLDALAGTAEIAAGIPSEVLLARPDIRAAEHRLRAANADIGAARAAFFPRLALTAALGTLAPGVSDLFGSGTRSWRVEPLVQTPIFAGGGLRANLRATEVEREIALASYERAIQTAFAEVADALVLATTLAEQRAAQDRLIGALEETLRLSEARYRAGIDGYLGVLVAQQALFEVQKASVRLRLAEQTNRIQLYKALGGGA